MELPNKTKAYIPSSKITEYLLSETHAVGKSKAKFFVSLGFGEETIDQLESALLKIAQTSEVREISENQHGTKYVMGALKVCWPAGFRRTKVLPQFMKVGSKPTPVCQSEGLPRTEQAALAPLVKIHLQTFSAPLRD